MGMTRYSFAEGMKSAMLSNPTMTQTDLYNSADVIASKTEVTPLLCFGFGQIYANKVTSENDVKNIKLDRGDAYRFCFGQAMDGDAISSANTRMQTAYNVFGVDIVDTEKAPTMAQDDTVLVGQKAIFTFTAAEGACTDGSDFADSINKVVVKDSNGTEKILTEDQYETSYNRLQKEDGSYYYIGVLTIKEGIFDKAGNYTVTVSADTYENAQATVEVQESKQAPVLKSNKVTLRYTTDPLTIKVTDGTTNWANNIQKITIIDAAGNEKVLDSEQYEVTDSAISLIRTEEDPIMSVSTADRTAEYKIKVEAVGYTTLEDTLTATMYGANSFQVRVVDSNGNVVKTRTFTMNEIKELSDKNDAYYNTICGMTGIRTFKANGISLSKLLETAGVTFGEGMTLKLRTNDSAESENDSTTDNAYFRLGSFTYEDLIGTDRYYFSGIFNDDTLKNTLLTGSKFGDDVKSALAAAEKEKVEPMFAYNYVEKVYRSTDGANLTEDSYNSLVGTENAFRFLFGIAMDPKDSSKISGTTTTWSASYAVFGIDIVDPSYDEMVPVTKYEAYTDHAKSDDYVSGDDTQSLHVSFTFAQKMKIVDKDALLAEMQFSLGGNPLSAEKNVVLDAKLSEDGKTLDITASGWFAAFSGKFQSVGKWNNLVSVEDGTPANAEIAFYVPNGLKTVTVEQNVAAENKNASVVTQIVAPENTTRGMVHLLLLKNGRPAVETNAHGGTAVGHFHNYMTMTAADFVKNTVDALQEALGDAYTVTAEDDKLTISATTSQPGDVLELHILSYLNTDNQNVNKTELDTVLKEIENLDVSAYTKETMELLNAQVAFAQIVQTSEYYSQEDVDLIVEKLLEAKKALKGIESVDNPSIAI